MLQKSSALEPSGFLNAFYERLFPGVYLNRRDPKDQLVDEVKASVSGSGNEKPHFDEEEVDGDLEEVKYEDNYEHKEGRAPNLIQTDLTTK